MRNDTAATRRARDRDTEHPGNEYLDAAFGIQEARRLRYVEEARHRPGSVWHDRPDLWDGTARTSNGSSAPSPRGAEPSRDAERPRSRFGLSVTRVCRYCGRAFAGRRRSAVYCGDLCRQRARRARAVAS